MSKVYDFTEAERLVASLEKEGKLNEEVLRAFAEQRRYEETVAALARLSHSRVEVIRPLMQSPRDDGFLVACKAAELDWKTVAAVLQCRLATGSMAPLELARCQRQFSGMSRENARRLLRFWQVRVSHS